VKRTKVDVNFWAASANGLQLLWELPHSAWHQVTMRRTRKFVDASDAGAAVAAVDASDVGAVAAVAAAVAVAAADAGPGDR
jgi:hypothetical protein